MLWKLYFFNGIEIYALISSCCHNIRDWQVPKDSDSSSVEADSIRHFWLFFFLRFKRCQVHRTEKFPVGSATKLLVNYSFITGGRVPTPPPSVPKLISTKIPCLFFSVWFVST